MLGFRVGVTVSARVRVRVRFPPIKNRSTYVGSLKLCGISDNACRHNSPKNSDGSIYRKYRFNIYRSFVSVLTRFRPQYSAV